MKSVLHKAENRGFANHGWLKAFHSFSFANYYDPERVKFGALRVLNDDTIAPGKGFGTHPHDNMEIIIIPTEGELRHQDSMGNGFVIKNGEIQVISAGRGITHSEYNNRLDKEVKLFQIWIFPNKKNVNPRYDQLTLSDDDLLNRFHQILSPNKEDDGVWIHQDAWIHLGRFTKDTTYTYDFKKSSNGLYIFIIEGEAVVGEETLSKRDGLGIWDVDSIEFSIKKFSYVLLMEIPMK